MRHKLVYSKDYLVDIGDHVFPTSKYSRVKEKLLREGPAEDIEFVTPAPATDEDVLLVHTEEYVNKLAHGTLTHEEIIALELPYSKELVRSAFSCCGGTMLASRIAMERGIGIHIGGGFHHAFPDHGEGFCVLNDIAVAIRTLKGDALIRRALVVDCDLHQGNGTAWIFSRDRDVYTFSIHQEHNYPFFKPKGSLDIGLRDGADDREYLDALDENIPRIIADFKPDFLLYVAGADPYEADQLGALKLTKEGLQRRDEFVFELARDHRIPICVVLAGGYAVREEDTVEIHYNTIVSGLRIFGTDSAHKQRSSKNERAKR